MTCCRRARSPAVSVGRADSGELVPIAPISGLQLPREQFRPPELLASDYLRSVHAAATDASRALAVLIAASAHCVRPVRLWSSRSKCHSERNRVRRERQRLGSNDSIESDPAVDVWAR